MWVKIDRKEKIKFVGGWVKAVDSYGGRMVCHFCSGDFRTILL